MSQIYDTLYRQSSSFPAKQKNSRDDSSQNQDTRVLSACAGAVLALALAVVIALVIIVCGTSDARILGVNYDGEDGGADPDDHEFDRKG